MGQPITRVALLGGTFDPIHEGHLHIIKNVLKHIPLDELWIMPNAVPPHKSAPILDTETRLRLCEAVIAECSQTAKRVRVRRTELKLPPPSYSVQTLRHLHKEEPATAFLWITGTDAWQGLPRWHQWKEVLNLTNWLVLERPGYAFSRLDDETLQTAWSQRETYKDIQWKQHQGGRVYTLNLELHPASSTQIREAWMKGKLDSVRAWLPDPVWEELSKNSPNSAK